MGTEKHNNISIVFSTREIKPAYIKELAYSCGIYKPDIIPIENKGEFSLSHAYNMGLEQAKNDLIVFTHDDVSFVTNNWGRKFSKHFSRNPDFGIIGVAGTDSLISGMWWEDRIHMHGIVNHSEKGKTWTSRFSQDQGNKIKEMVVLDGVFFAIDKTKIIHKFDEEFKGYHFYDLSFIFPNYLAGVKIGACTDIRITHMSVGRTNEMWEENKKQFEEKYKQFLPCQI